MSIHGRGIFEPDPNGALLARQGGSKVQNILSPLVVANRAGRKMESDPIFSKGVS